MGYGWDWKPYVTVAERKAKAEKYVKKLQKQGHPINPIVVAGKIIAKTFWGKSWCDHLESFSDFENRLPRGRTYVRNGSVLNLQIRPGKIEALVMGSELYQIEINIQTMQKAKWKQLIEVCAGKI